MITIYRRYIFRIFILLIFSFFSINVGATDVNRNKAFAGFIKHIHSNTKTVRGGSDFCIFGSDEVSLRIKSMANKNFVDLGDEIDYDKDYSNCRVIYIAKNKEKEAKYSVNFFNDKGALTIAIFPSFISDGGMMSIDIGRRNFELLVNDMVLKKFGVKIDSSIAALIVE